MSDMTVAREILRQLGGNAFTMMTGAKNFVGGDNFLTFRLGRGAAKGITTVHITLTPADTYAVTFYRVRGTKATLVDAVDDIYADALRDVISHTTGFTLTVPRIVGINA